jgi:PBP1b-binding outer membrane lipoprotein LpoB
LATLALSGCATKVTRVDADSQIDLSGYWNDTDVRQVAQSLITEILASRNVQRQADQWRASHDGENPSVVIGGFRNRSDEHIDTAIVARMLQTAIINSGELDFVANKDQRGELLGEIDYQNSGAVSDESAASYGKAAGATFTLTGTVNSMVDTDKEKTVRTYFVDAQLINVETQKIIWQGQNDEIKKFIKRQKARL